MSTAARLDSTVRDVHEALGREDGKSAGYTTTLKQVQVMTAKELVIRDESSRSHVYAANVAEARTKRRLVKDLLDRAFGGSSAALAPEARRRGCPTAGHSHGKERADGPCG